MSVAPVGFPLLNLAKPMIGGTIIGIGTSVFRERAALEEIRLPSTLTTIDKDAFSGCTALKTVSPFLPASLTSLDATVFYNCPITTPLTLSNPALTTMIDNGAYGVFTYCRFETADLSGCGLTNIARCAFQGNSSLKEIRLPMGLEAVRRDAFTNCSSLTNVVPFLPASVTSIGETAFYNCPIKNSLTLSNSALTLIPNNGVYGIFYGGKFATADLSKSGIITIGRSAFHDNSTLSNMLLPRTLATIEYDAFTKTTSLKEVNFRSLPVFEGNSFNVTMGLPARFTYPRSSAEWANFVATATEGGTLKPWASSDVTDGERDTYRAEFPGGPKPVGKMLISNSWKWLVPCGNGTTIIVK